MHASRAGFFLQPPVSCQMLPSVLLLGHVVCLPGASQQQSIPPEVPQGRFQLSQIWHWSFVLRPRRLGRPQALPVQTSPLLFKLYQFFPVMPPQCPLCELWLKEVKPAECPFRAEKRQFQGSASTAGKVLDYCASCPTLSSSRLGKRCVVQEGVACFVNSTLCMQRAIVGIRQHSIQV